MTNGDGGEVGSSYRDCSLVMEWRPVERPPVLGVRVLFPVLPKDVARQIERAAGRPCSVEQYWLTTVNRKSKRVEKDEEHALYTCSGIHGMLSVNVEPEPIAAGAAIEKLVREGKALPWFIIYDGKVLCERAGDSRTRGFRKLINGEGMYYINEKARSYRLRELVAALEENEHRIRKKEQRAVERVEALRSKIEPHGWSCIRSCLRCSREERDRMDVLWELSRVFQGYGRWYFSEATVDVFLRAHDTARALASLCLSSASNLSQHEMTVLGELIESEQG